MDIYFKSKALEKACNSEKESIKKWGPILARKIHQRLYELYAAENLSILSHLPPARCHELVSNKKGSRLFAVDLTNNYRLIFEPAHDPLPLKDDGGLDRTRVTMIRILDAASDYHDRKKR